MADVTELVNYYANLLIIQYNGLTKAAGTISLLASAVLAQGVAIDVANAYNVESSLGATAVGDQLDVIGKYVGVDRFFATLNLTNYFALVTYLQQQSSSLPSSPPAWGVTTYADFSNYNYNGTLEYNEVITSENALSDSNFLTLIQLAIARNNMNFSVEAIDTNLWTLFGSSIRVEEGNVNMTMVVFFAGAETTLTQAILAKKLLPKPMGVALLAVVNIYQTMFAMISYASEANANGYGFSTYSNYASLTGQDLTYSQITEY